MNKPFQSNCNKERTSSIVVVIFHLRNGQCGQNKVNGHLGRRVFERTARGAIGTTSKYLFRINCPGVVSMSRLPCPLTELFDRTRCRSCIHSNHRGFPKLLITKKTTCASPVGRLVSQWAVRDVRHDCRFSGSTGKPTFWPRFLTDELKLPRASSRYSTIAFMPTLAAHSL